MNKLVERHLSAAARRSLPQDDFALPGRRYPVEDKAHARDALSRVSANGTAEEKSRVRAKVCRKFPGMPSCRESIDALFEESVCPKCGKVLVQQAHAAILGRELPLLHKDTGRTVCGEHKPGRYVPTVTKLARDEYEGGETDWERNQ